MIQFFSGIIVSEFDEKAGPSAIGWIGKDLNQQSLKIVPNITLETFQQENLGSKDLMIIPMPSIEQKALVKIIEFTNLRGRTHKDFASITLLYAEKNDTIFYKYKQDFEEVFQELTEKYLILKATNTLSEILPFELEKFQNKLNEILNLFSENESNETETVEFPGEYNPAEQQLDFAFKLIVVGDPAVGKTSIILRYTDKAFRYSYLPTIGVNITEKSIRISKTRVKLMLWDLAGQAKYLRIRHQFYMGVDAVILVYDLTNRTTFENIKKWYDDLKANVPNFNKVKLILCGNKSDRDTDIQITTMQGLNLAQHLSIDFMEISALNNVNIKIIFSILAEKLYNEKQAKINLFNEIIL